jgi:hypothetical protein
MLWTDDDMAVPNDWLTNYINAAEKFPEASLFGGPIRAWFADDVAADVRQFALDHLKALGPIFGLNDLGPEVRELRSGEPIFSGNMALRTEPARRFRFNARFGRVRRDGLLGGEETLFIQDMLDGGERGVWVGNATSEHFIPGERLTRAYIWKYFVGVGRTQGRIDGIKACPTVLGRPRWAVLQHWRERTTGWWKRQAGRDWLPSYLTAAKLAGYIEECLAHRSNRPDGYLVPPHRSTVTLDA